MLKASLGYTSVPSQKTPRTSNAAVPCPPAQPSTAGGTDLQGLVAALVTGQMDPPRNLNSGSTLVCALELTEASFSLSQGSGILPDTTSRERQAQCSWPLVYYCSEAGIRFAVLGVGF